MQLRIYAFLPNLDQPEFTHPVLDIEEAKSVLSVLPRFFDWTVDQLSKKAPELSSRLEVFDDQTEKWETWYSENRLTLWEEILVEVRQALEEADDEDES